jgi:uncharacterized membrane protein YecN with MAPEG domain
MFNYGRYLGTSASSGESDPLLSAIRCHGNYIENIPFAILVSAVAEMNGANRTYLNYGLGLLFAARVAHAELGIRGQGAQGPGRLPGHLVTYGFLATVAGYSAWMVKEYWGL